MWEGLRIVQFGSDVPDAVPGQGVQDLGERQRPAQHLNDPSLILDDEELELSWKEHTVQTKNGLQFNAEVKSRILFEFHDVNHLNPMPEVNLAVLRDVISFLKPSDQEKLVT